MNIEEPAQLLPYLRAHAGIAADERPRFVRLHGGVSNRAVLVQHAAGPWVVKQALPKLRVAVDWFSEPARIEREAAGLRWLEAIAPGRAPSLVFHDSENHILAMTAVPQPHENWKSLLLRGETSVEQARQFGALLARIHNAVLKHPALAVDFAERKYFEELRLEPYYSYAASQVPAARAFLHALIDDAQRRRLALTHGDYSPKNVLIHDRKLIILDFEVMHFGDPAFDVGFSLTHLLSKAHHLPARRGAFIEMARAYWRAYHGRLDAALKRGLEAASARHALACLLARVAGRSPLEYLGESQRQRQRAIVVELMRQDIHAIPALIDDFAHRLEATREPSP